MPEVEEDSYEEILQCVFGVLSYRLGQLDFNPRLGIPDQIFRQAGANLNELRAAISQGEPRASVVISDPQMLLSLIDLVNINIVNTEP